MNEHKEPIPSMIYNASIGGHVTNSQQIIDENENKEQSQINTEVKQTLANLADDEDLTSVDNGTGSKVLKFADKKYNPTNFSGLGRVYLRKNIVEVEQEDRSIVHKNVLTQDMINKENTEYIIQYDYDLNGEEITIPDNCYLTFKKGTFINGTIKGKLLNSYLNIRDFGVKDDNIDYGKYFENILISAIRTNVRSIYIPKGTYIINNAKLKYGYNITDSDLQNLIGNQARCIKFTIFGDGEYSTIKSTNSFLTIAGDYHLHKLIHGISIRDFNIEGNNIASTCFEIHSVQELSIKNVRIHQFTHQALNCYDLMDSVFENVEILRCATAIITENVSAIELKNEYNSSNALKFTDCHFELCPSFLYGGGQGIYFMNCKYEKGSTNNNKNRRPIHLNSTSTNLGFIGCHIVDNNYESLNEDGYNISDNFLPFITCTNFDKNWHNTAFITFSECIIYNSPNKYYVLCDNINNVVFNNCAIYNITAVQNTGNDLDVNLTAPIKLGFNNKFINCNFKLHGDIQTIFYAKEDNNIIDNAIIDYYPFIPTDASYNNPNNGSFLLYPVKNFTKISYKEKNKIYSEFPYAFGDLKRIPSIIYPEGNNIIFFCKNYNVINLNDMHIDYTSNVIYTFYCRNIYIEKGARNSFDAISYCVYGSIITITNNKNNDITLLNKRENRGNLNLSKDIILKPSQSISLLYDGNYWVNVEGNDINSTLVTSGTFANKPTGVDIGYAYFCIDKQTTEGTTNGIMIYHKGGDVWVDALGRVVS